MLGSVHEFFCKTLPVYAYSCESEEVTNQVPEKKFVYATKIVSKYDQETPQSQTVDNPVAPRGRAAQPSRDTRKTY